jgi:hypothetical protein
VTLTPTRRALHRDGAAIVLELAGVPGVFDRDVLATAVLLRIDEWRDVQVLRRELMDLHDVSRAEAIRHLIAARHCIDNNIEL